MNQALLERYAQAFVALSPASLDTLCSLVSEQVHFRDPFNDTHGREALRHLLMDMFKRSGDPSFTVQDACWNETAGWLRWRFSAELPVIGKLEVEGCSRVLFDEAGLVREHVDYWDSAPVYLQLPLLGRVLRRIRRRLSSRHGATS